MKITVQATQSIRTNIIRTICNFFTNKKNKKQMEKQTNQAVLTIYSQPHVLQHRMKEENLKHGDHVKADIGPIRLESYFGKMVMYFCPMVTVEVKERLTLGDGAVLPAEATLEGFDKLPVNTKPGLYWLKNVELFSNGTMQVIANANSELVPA